MASANVEGMLREGVNAMKAGRRDEARALLLRAVELDQYNEEAWLWLSGVLDSLEDQRTALENVLSINPGNENARQGLDYINQQLGISSPPPLPSAPSAMPPDAGGLSTSVEWGAPPSTPEPGRYPPPAPEPTPDVLDDWVNNLGLPSGSTGAIEDLRQTLGASPFGDIDLGEDEDDIFAAGPFRADAPASAESVPPPAAPSLTPEQRAERTAQRRAKRDERRTTQDAAPKPRQAPAVEVMFPGIPAEIKPTRLPGTIEQAPIITTLLIALLVIANLGLAVYFMVGFFCANPIHCPWV